MKGDSEHLEPETRVEIRAGLSWAIGFFSGSVIALVVLALVKLSDRSSLLSVLFGYYLIGRALLTCWVCYVNPTRVEFDCTTLLAIHRKGGTCSYPLSSLTVSPFGSPLVLLTGTSEVVDAKGRPVLRYWMGTVGLQALRRRIEEARRSASGEAAGERKGSGTREIPDGGRP